MRSGAVICKNFAGKQIKSNQVAFVLTAEGRD
jgi:hypothetical protein